MKIPGDHHIAQVLSGLEYFPVVAIAGSRQIGKLFTVQGRECIGYEFKLSSAPRTTKSMQSAIEALAPDKLYVVYPGDEHWPRL